MSESAMRNRVGDLVALVSTFSVMLCAYGAVRAFYFGGSLLQPLSYSSDERPLNEIANSWIGRDPSQTLIGIHAFGDYLLTNVWVQFPDPWSAGVPVNYLPGLLLVFRVLDALPYMLGLWLYLTGMAICLVAPMFWASRGERWSTRIILMLALGLVTGPAIASLDRGNPQGFIPVLLFGFAVAVLRERNGWAAAFIVAAATIKVYPMLLILVLVALRRYRAAGAALAAFLVVNLAALLVMSPRRLLAIPDVVAGVLQFQEASLEKFLTYNVPLAGGVANLAIAIGWSGAATWIASHAWLVTLVFLVFSLPLLWFRALELWLRLVLALMVTVASMPIVYSYALNWAVAAAAVLVFVGLRQPLIRAPRWWLILALALVLAIAPVFIPGSMEAGRPVGVASILAVGAAVLIPAGMWWSLRGVRRRVAPA